MTHISAALKATGRSLKLAPIRLAVGLGAHLAPARTSEFIADRFFTTEKLPAGRPPFAGESPVASAMQTPDGEVMTYRWGNVDRDPTVVLVHGWNGWAQQLEQFVAPLRSKGFAVIAFDHVAHGQSAGRQSSLPVMTRAVDHVLAHLPHAAGVIAHSLGAAATASALSSSRRRLQGAVLIAPPSDPRPYLAALSRILGAPQRLTGAIERAAERIAGVALLRLTADPWTVRRIRTPLMIVHDVNDLEVPISNGYAYTTGNHARMLATDGLGHRRILRDLHVVDEAVGFIAAHQKTLDRRRSLIAA